MKILMFGFSVLLGLSARDGREILLGMLGVVIGAAFANGVWRDSRGKQP